ncbi:uncharacterized protein LOC133920018 [Phragmites australis]|uniref:uncharacterized protein LOC133920018 n=1 Tax=Phragmites australis TaxID=29695 RepID=UPI002D77E9A5|nr:uncharacterized protein LOC133920018 [Phragmites australis]
MALRRINARRKPLLLVPRGFSSSSSKPPFPPPPPPPPANDPDAAHSRSSFPPANPGAPPNPASSLFHDIRERLRSSPTPPPPRRIPMNPPRPNSTRGAPPSPSIDEIRKMLESFRGSRAAGGAPSPSAPGATPSFQDLLKNSAALAPNAGNKAPGFDAIRESLKLGQQPQQRPTRSPTPFLSPFSHNIFSKELVDRTRKAEGAGKEEEKDHAIALTRIYSYEELGKRLGELRPAGAAKDGKEWFSLEELQGRIAKLVKLEEQDVMFGGQYSEIRKSIMSMSTKQSEKSARLSSMQMALLSNIGGQSTLDYMRLPPQEELLERYFHPDHMSSEEKMKLELQRVRDEFKMSENDCGSARVQIAQLTVKIKHLSSVLHKKDKHSRKGLQDMVQRRKKYLKYLRGTDWDSYCLVLSKLGLRDVPEYKAPDYKNKSITKAKSKKSKSKGKKKRKMKA